ncbi:MAG: hypothetical protein H6839_10285 [Planctomycetes bacterium]|nr:hypothetical protein [Planctomycetota bacterium]
MSVERETIRHFLATLNYRLRGAVRGAPSFFYTYLPPADGRNAVEVLHHVNDLLRFVVRSFDKGSIVPISPREPQAELDTFAKLLKLVDEHLQKTELRGDINGRPLSLEVLLQGPLADAMTHVGQLTMLRRQSGSPIDYENFMLADIKPGEFPE